MNISATLEKLNTMRMHGFEQAYRNVLESALQEKYTSDELIAHLVDAEYDDKYNRKLSRLIKNAGFKQQVSLEHIDYHHPRNIDRNLILRLQSCDWINKGRDLLIVGATGTGKSFLACAFGMQACINEHKTLYFTASNLLDKLTYAKADGTYFKFLDFIAKAKLLIIDDFGLKKVDASQCNMLLDVIDERHAKSSTIISSQLQVKEWYDCFAQKTIAEAILDRVLNSSYRILLEGEISMRKKLRKTEE